MSDRHCGSIENAELRTKINEAKSRLPLPELMSRLGLAAHANKSARCPFPEHEDKHPSFSVFKGKDGYWHYKCFVCDPCGGDEINLLVKHFNISRREAIKGYLDMAGFPCSPPSNSHEYPKCPESPESRECRVFPVCPVSNGQGLNGDAQSVLKRLAARNACTQSNTARSRRWQLVRDLRAVERGIGRELKTRELMPVFEEWHRLSQPFLDPAKTRDYYEAKFLSEFSKVRFATGDGTLTTALEKVAELSADQLPEIPGKPNAPESWRRLTALHRELSCLRGKPTHFLAYRDAARVFDGMSHQEAHAITGALETLDVIKIVSKGKAGLNSREASEFRYLLPQGENGAQEYDGGFQL